jgi:hypothetical protein
MTILRLIEQSRRKHELTAGLILRHDNRKDETIALRVSVTTCDLDFSPHCQRGNKWNGRTYYTNTQESNTPLYPEMCLPRISFSYRQPCQWHLPKAL